MVLDLEKFTELSKTADLSRATGKFSSIYLELDKAWSVIAELLIVKNATQKTVVKLLQDSGMRELKIHNFSGWWSKKSTQRKRKAFLSGIKVDKPKIRPMAGVESMEKLKKGFE